MKNLGFFEMMQSSQIQRCQISSSIWSSPICVPKNIVSENMNFSDIQH